ncbi:ribonuclease E/G [Pararhodobacter sp. SW119]|uniref:ribonuclease E/G n=1 Tax=Pararhodobacter sp. SW119 TaxID=2780075 RepID=UPI001AE0BCFE|nr:ribonuclease E/G [Pararhodobacter sp. SW119]
MKGSVIALGTIDGREVAALMVDGRLEDLALETEGLAPAAILRGTVGRPVKGLGGVFVDLPDGLRGFLRQTRGLAPGQPVLVQVSGAAEPGKAVPLTTRLLIKGHYVILTPDAPGINVSRQIRNEALRTELTALGEGALAGAAPTLGLILRSACEEAAPEDVAAEAGDLRALTDAICTDTQGPPELLLDPPAPRDLAWRDWPLPDVFDDGPDALDHHGVREALDALVRPDVALGSGASMTVEATRALVAVDVNTGADVSPAAGLKASIAAVRELPRQLRLRGLGGQVVIDFAPFPKRDRAALQQVLRKAFRGEANETVLAGWTPLGNYELQRRRDRAPLADWLRA